jgi:hypothetical protein
VSKWLLMTFTTQASTRQVRRDVTGGKRANGNQRTRRVPRCSIRNGQVDRNLTEAAGLA